MKRRPIFEITMFWNEKGIFKERVLNTLSYAHTLVIAEGNESHSGKISRPFLVPSLINDLPDELKPRVIHIPVDLTKILEKNPFQREKIVRDSALHFLKNDRSFTDDCILLIQDFDEFIHPDKADLIENALYGWRFWRRAIRIRQYLSYFQLNLKSDSDWTLALAVTGSLARSPHFSPNLWRHKLAKKKAGLTSGFLGWHHSYLGDFEFIRNKLDSFAEAEIDLVRGVTDEQIVERMRRGEDLFGRNFNYQRVDYGSVDPIPVLMNRKDLQLP